MQRVRLVMVVLIVIALSACSRSGKGGRGTADEYAMGEGNIPVAQAGAELMDVNFEFDSAELDASSQAKLRENSSWLLDNTGDKVVIEGHCDERGTAEYNLALGERRARSVYNFLRSLGVKPAQMGTISYGEELPLDSGSTEAAWAKNRRAHFSVAGK